MPTIDEFVIPDALLSEMLRLVDRAKASSLLPLAKIMPSLGRGLRPTLANAKFIRQRLAATISSSMKLNEEIRDFLAHESLNGQLIMVLSESVLAVTLTELLAIYGRERLLAAILVDARYAVRKLAINYCHQEDWFLKMLPDQEVALASLAATMQPFLLAIEPLVACCSGVDGHSPKGDDSLGVEIQGYRQKIVDLEARLRQAKEDKKTERKAENRLEALQNRIVELEGKFARERQAKLTAESARIEAETSAQILREGYAGEVRTGIQTELQATIRTWLFEPLKTAEAVDLLLPDPSTDILEQVAVVLASQEERDRHYGNRRRLHNRLNDLRQANSTLLQAASESINPLSELTTLIAAVQLEVDRLESLLEEKSPVAPMVQRLIASIRQAKCQSDLDRNRLLLQELDASACLSHREIRLLYREYHACLGRLFERFAPKPLAEPNNNDPALVVNRAFANGGKFLLLLDGYNILFCLEDIFAESYEGGRPAAHSRKRLLEMVQTLLSETDGLADVFFDGEVAAQENFSAQVKVIYSGGGGSTVRNRADQSIIDHLERQPVGGNTPAVVVTDDQELGRRCQSLGAKVMPLQEFAAYLQH
ncbi:MAG: NYN domain-containing protein [Desulfobulbaceae bacterium]|nr:NYN domain-containing protein [Desulfobulbaceae bacterium]